MQQVVQVETVVTKAMVVGAEDASRLADIFSALADPTRVRIISALLQQELCVGELAELVGISVSALSHQLAMLRRLRIVHSRREGRHIYYALDDDHIVSILESGLNHIRHT